MKNTYNGAISLIKMRFFINTYVCFLFAVSHRINCTEALKSNKSLSCTRASKKEDKSVLWKVANPHTVRQ